MRVLAALLLALLLPTEVASGHQQKTAITRVLFNENSGNLEVMHRFNLHDAEHAARRLLLREDGKRADILADSNTQQHFADYVTRRFFMGTDSSTPLPLKYVGHELEGEYFWVYQEVAIPQNIAELHLRHHALRDIWKQQINSVNIEFKGKVKTLIFDGSRHQQQLLLQHP